MRLTVNDGHLDFQMYRGGPRPLSSFETHARWQPVTQSARSRRSYGKIEDCEQSIEISISPYHADHVLVRAAGMGSRAGLHAQRLVTISVPHGHCKF